MANQKLTDLAAAALPLQSSDLFYVVQNVSSSPPVPTDQKIAFSDLLTQIPSGGSGASAYASDNTGHSISSSIPIDNTIPQNTEGTELITVAITPISAASKVRLTVDFWWTNNSVGSFMVVAFFIDSIANAWAATLQRCHAANGGDHFVFTAEVALGDTSAHTLKVRAGRDAGTLFINQTTGSVHVFGAAANITLAATEILT